MFLPRKSSAKLLAILPLGLLIGACGGDDPEQKLKEAENALAEARSGVEQARESVHAAEQGVAKAQDELEGSRRDLVEAEKRLADAEQKVDLRATDELLFRKIQRLLLDDDDLKSTAISVRVSKGVVTLEGSVADLKLRERAIEIAKATPGVAKVDSQISVVPGVAAGE